MRRGESGSPGPSSVPRATTGLPFGVVNASGRPYHPAIVAQAAATLTEMCPAAAGWDLDAFIDAVGERGVPGLR